MLNFFFERKHQLKICKVQKLLLTKNLVILHFALVAGLLNMLRYRAVLQKNSFKTLHLCHKSKLRILQKSKKRYGLITIFTCTN